MAGFYAGRRRWLGGMGGLAALALGGCGGSTLGIRGDAGAPLPAPRLAVGDRWTYRCVDGFRVPVEWTETHEVIVVAPQDIQVRVTGEGAVRFQRIEHWLEPGVVAAGSAYDPAETRVFTPPMIRYRFPLTSDDTWRQSLRNPDAQTQIASNIQRSVAVGGFQPVAVPAGSFNALTMRTLMVVDDNNPFNFPIQCNYVTWWAADAGAMVRMTKRATYRERGDNSWPPIDIVTQNTTIELVDYRYGARRG